MNHPASNATGVRHINVINMYTPDKIHLEDLTFSSYDGDVIQKCNVEIGDIFLTRSSLKPEGIAEANVLLDDGRFIYDDHLIRLKINKNEYVPLFVKINLGVPFIKEQFISKSKTTAFTTIGQDDISECVGLFPEKEEQQKIAIFFHNLNTLITLHQRKYEKLVNIKKSMLDKMFPQNGASVPEIRFKGFTDPWEQRKVGELLTERNEQAPMSDEYPLMAFIANEGVAPKGERYDRSALVNDTASKLYKKTKFGDFIYSSNNLETGSIGLNKYGKASISPVYSIFKPTGIADSDFLGRRLIRKDFINEMVKWRQGVIYGQWRIHESDFIKIEVTVPTVEEQYKLGLLLDNLDTLITLHQRKLEKLQNIKKSCLEKMFV